MHHLCLNFDKVAYDECGHRTGDVFPFDVSYTAIVQMTLHTQTILGLISLRSYVILTLEEPVLCVQCRAPQRCSDILQHLFPDVAPRPKQPYSVGYFDITSLGRSYKHAFHTHADVLHRSILDKSSFNDKYIISNENGSIKTTTTKQKQQQQQTSKQQQQQHKKKPNGSDLIKHCRIRGNKSHKCQP